MHERSTSDELGAWLDDVEGDGDLSDLDRDVVRIARRDWDRQRRVPVELAAARVQAAAEGQGVWLEARARSDFAMFAPALERNVALAREYAACFEHDGRPYDALLADYDYGLTAARVQEIFGPLAEALPPLVAEAAARPPRRTSRCRPRRSGRRCAESCVGWAWTTSSGVSTTPRTRSACR